MEFKKRNIIAKLLLILLCLTFSNSWSAEWTADFTTKIDEEVVNNVSLNITNTTTWHTDASGSGPFSLNNGSYQVVTYMNENESVFLPENASSDAKVATIKITAEDGITTNTYTVSFTIEANDDATLASITINDKKIGGFNVDKLEYSYTMSNNETIEVNANVNDENATVIVNKPEEYPGIIEIIVTAEDGSTTTYEIDVDIIVNSANFAKVDFDITYTKGSLNIYLGNIEKASNLTVIAANGVIVHQQKLLESKSIINVSNYSVGVYYVSINSGLQQTTKSIVIR